MTTTIYYDSSDNDMDGCGWNVVTGDEAFAWRFTTKDEAIAFCQRNNTPYQMFDLIEESDLTPDFPREVVITRDYGAGLSTWWHTPHKIEIVESPTLIKAVRDGLNKEDTQQALINAGFPSEVINNLYWAGLKNAEVATVHGPYIINEYDGREYIIERDKVNWNT